MEFNSFCLSATLETERGRENKTVFFPGIQELKFEGQHIKSFIDGPLIMVAMSYFIFEGKEIEAKKKKEKSDHTMFVFSKNSPRSNSVAWWVSLKKKGS